MIGLHMATSQNGVCLAVRREGIQGRESFGLGLDNHCCFLQISFLRQEWLCVTALVVLELAL